MKKILMAITLLISMVSCQFDYPEEVTFIGSNTHGFKLNGEKWVREKGFPPTSGCTFESKIGIISCNLNSIKEDSINFPSGSFQFILSANPKSTVIPIHYDFSDLNDLIISNYETPNYLDSTKCYCLLYYEKGKFKHSTYSNVISGKLQLLRFDSLLVGTFEAQLSNGIDTIAITDGKFDYKIIMD